MKTKAAFLSAAVFLFSAAAVVAQNNQVPNKNEPQTIVPSNYYIETISTDLTKIAKSVESLNDRLKKFSETFSSNQGLKLSEKQQQLLLAFEILNRAEERLATLQKLRLDIAEKQSSIRIQLNRVAADSLPESIDRYVSTRATTNATQLREMRQQALYKEKNDLTSLLNEAQNNIEEINSEIRQTEIFIKSIRHRLFAQANKELEDL